MVHISLPPEPPAAVIWTVEQETVQAASSSANKHSTSTLGANELIASSQWPSPFKEAIEPSVNFSLLPSVASQLAQQAEPDLPTLSPAPAEPATVEEETAPQRLPAVSDSEDVEPPELLSESNSGTFDLEAEEKLSTDHSGEDSPTSSNSIELDDLRSPENGDFASQLRLSADLQEYDPITQTVRAQGNVVLRLNDAIIETDELRVNLLNRYALADGDVLLTRGAQLVRGRRLEYNFIQQSGIVGDAIGTLYLPAIDEDLSSPLIGVTASRRAYDPINRNPDLQIENEGNLLYGTRLSTQPPENDDTDIDGRELSDEESASGDSLLRQLRFETDELVFDVEGWRADNVRITNDPFSPPELELRTDGLLLRTISATQDELLLRRPRLVFDQGLAIPLLRSRILLSRGGLNPDDLNPVPAPVGIDSGDRGGLFIGREIPLVTDENIRLSITPQFFAARAFSSDASSPVDWDNFGITTDLEGQLSSRTTLRGSAELTSLDTTRLTENLRATLRAEQQIGNHRLSLQSSYRERLFNGSLGFRDVQASLGAVLLSPAYKLGDTGLRLTYQASAQLINAESDRQTLLDDNDSETGRITAARYQASAALRHNLNLWRGKPKPPTQEEGLRFTPSPVVPYVDLKTGLRTVLTSYSTGDEQNSLIADIGLEAQFGHFARNFGDYTRLNAAYSQSFIGEADSPFLFDREVDRNVLTLGIVQQIYGPFLFGFQTAFSFDENEPINNIYSLEYSRRTYGLVVRYDTAQNVGSIGFRLSNFRWIGNTNPFDTPRIRRVQGGVIETR